jgi:hypothetical protein
VKPLNWSTFFLKEREVVTSSNYLHVALDLSTQIYEDTIATARNDLKIIDIHYQVFTPVVELNMVESYVNTLEVTLREFLQVIPRSDKRRGLVDLGGSVLKTLFGTATIADLHQVPSTLSELEAKEAVIFHSPNNQLSYVKGIALSSQVNSDAIANLSNVIKSEIIQLHDRYTRLVSDAWRINVTVADYSSLSSLIRQMEFLLLQMTVQFDELNMAVQTVLLGRLPVAIIKPNVLHEILRNLSLIFPETYKLIAGVKLQDIHKYYDLISTSMVGSAHGLCLIFEIPLKSENQIFSLYRIMTLPVKVFKDTFAVYSSDCQLIGWSYDQKDYVRMTKLDLRACKIGSISLPG